LLVDLVAAAAEVCITAEQMEPEDIADVMAEIAREKDGKKKRKNRRGRSGGSERGCN